jgi:hypothetical protein
MATTLPSFMTRSEAIGQSWPLTDTIAGNRNWSEEGISPATRGHARAKFKALVDGAGSGRREIAGGSIARQSHRQPRQDKEIARMKVQNRKDAGGVLVALLAIVVAGALAAGWFWFFLTWDYSAGERAGWVQKLSKKGWICKTWEGEMAMVTMPGTAQEKFAFTVRSDDVAAQLNKVMGKRVAVHYEEKVGLPTTCFGETRHYVVAVTAVEDIPLAPGIVVPSPAQPPARGSPAVQPTPSATTQ